MAVKHYLSPVKRQSQIFWHVLFWLCMIAYFVYLALDNARLSKEALLVIFGLFSLVNIGLFYLNYLYLIPRFLDRKKYRSYTIVLCLLIVALALGKYWIALNFKAFILIRGNKVTRFRTYFTSALLTNIFFLFLSTGLKFAVDWFLNERVKRDLVNQRLSAELAFLKSQINPHFLFNSLNSIYSLSYQQSPSAPQAILKLSEIMRYMLYESNDGKVELAKELQYLENYIDLQKIRLGEKSCIDFTITGEVGGQKIVPLLLIAFIENAFKHGISNDPLSPIRLKIELDGNMLHFYAENRKHSLNRDTAGGIGLQNVKRRLNLLYPGNYRLNIEDEPGRYACELSLVLSDDPVPGC